MVASLSVGIGGEKRAEECQNGTEWEAKKKEMAEIKLTGKIGFCQS